MSPRTPSEYKSASSRRTVDNTADLNGWKYIAKYSGYLIYAKDDIRRLIDTDTGRVITQYRFGHAGEGGIDAGL